jgi:glucosamine-6-phosphate deaminase
MDTEMKKIFKVDSLNVEILDSAEQAGRRAAEFVVSRLQQTISEKGTANLILATGVSQFTFLQALKSAAEPDWSIITVFHLDEYLGMSDQHSASFRRYLRERILDAVKPARIYLLEGDAQDIDAEIRRYEDLLGSNPVDERPYRIQRPGGSGLS